MNMRLRYRGEVEGILRNEKQLIGLNRGLAFSFTNFPFSWLIKRNDWSLQSCLFESAPLRPCDRASEVAYS